MDMHTEKTLKTMTKPQLLEIAAANEIEVPDGTKNDDIKALILQKECPVANQGGATDETKSPAPDSGGDNSIAAQESESVPKFTKEQLLKSNWYSHRRDALTVLLDDDKTYSHATVGRLISEFMKGKVK